MKSLVVSTSSSRGSMGGSSESNFESPTPVSNVVRRQYCFRSRNPSRADSGSPKDDKGSVSRVFLNAESSSRTPSVVDLASPLRFSKFESNKSLNRSSEFSKEPLDFDILSKYCTFSSG